MVYILLILSLFLAFGIGANDETMATVVGSGSLKLRISVYIGGVLVVLGCLFLKDLSWKNDCKESSLRRTND